MTMAANMLASLWAQQKARGDERTGVWAVFDGETGELIDWAATKREGQRQLSMQHQHAYLARICSPDAEYNTP